MILERSEIDRTCWHRWFAWRPVTIRLKKEGKCAPWRWLIVWWVWIERQQHDSWGDSWWEYRLPPEGPGA